MPALTKKSVIAVLNFVYPVLKSSPTIKVPVLSANYIAPGTKVF